MMKERNSKVKVKERLSFADFVAPGGGGQGDPLPLPAVWATESDGYERVTADGVGSVSAGMPRGGEWPTMVGSLSGRANARSRWPKMA
jgi:hypothetical protein